MLLAWERAVGAVSKFDVEGIEEGQAKGVWRSVLKQRTDLDVVAVVLLVVVAVDDEELEDAADEVVVA
jgi:hypothetical protein